MMLPLKYWYVILGLSFSSYSQIAQYNHFPTKQPAHILDEKLENISFAFSLRLLESNYNGPLIRLRRTSDNAEMDFACGDDDRVDLNAIDTWRAGANLFVTIWYDQSGLERHAFQTNKAFQPQFIPDAIQPYFAGDGGNDVLIVPENFQNLTENGKNGSVIGVFFATDRSDSAFGVIRGRERWLTHINWGNERCYFDPGYCCNITRSFSNNTPTNIDPGSLGIWDQYSFVRRDDNTNPSVDRTIMRLATVEKANGGFPNNQSCNLTVNFGICATISNGANGSTAHSNTRFAEFIMYRIGLEDSFLETIEQNQINFWNL